jgi:hypothetical protein
MEDVTEESLQPPQVQHEVVISTALDPEMKVKKNYQRGEENQVPPPTASSVPT